MYTKNIFEIAEIETKSNNIDSNIKYIGENGIDNPKIMENIELLLNECKRLKSLGRSDDEIQRHINFKDRNISKDIFSDVYYIKLKIDLTKNLEKLDKSLSTEENIRQMTKDLLLSINKASTQGMSDDSIKNLIETKFRSSTLQNLSKLFVYIVNEVQTINIGVEKVVNIMHGMNLACENEIFKISAQIEEARKDGDEEKVNNLLERKENYESMLKNASAYLAIASVDFQVLKDNIKNLLLLADKMRNDRSSLDENIAADFIQKFYYISLGSNNIFLYFALIANHFISFLEMNPQEVNAIYASMDRISVLQTKIQLKIKGGKLDKNLIPKEHGKIPYSLSEDLIFYGSGGGATASAMLFLVSFYQYIRDRLAGRAASNVANSISAANQINTMIQGQEIERMIFSEAGARSIIGAEAGAAAGGGSKLAVVVGSGFSLGFNLITFVGSLIDRLNKAEINTEVEEKNIDFIKKLNTFLDRAEELYNIPILKSLAT